MEYSTPKQEREERNILAKTTIVIIAVVCAMSLMSCSQKTSTMCNAYDQSYDRHQPYNYR